MNRRETKTIALVALIIGVAALTIGFAAFSRNLTIESSAGYTTSQTDLDVVFSTAGNSVKTGEVHSTGTATGSTFLILPSSQATISDISVNFTAKGQKAEYDFYIYNNSNYTAYLTSIKMGDMLETTSSNAILCFASEGTNQDLVDNACKDMKYTLATTDTVSTIIAQATGEGGSLRNKNKISIPANTAVPVKLTIEYTAESENVVPDGDFRVDIGTLKLEFSTQE